MYHISIFIVNKFIHALIVQIENIHKLPDCQILREIQNHIPILSAFQFIIKTMLLQNFKNSILIIIKEKIITTSKL